MKVRGFEKFQHYHLAALYERIREGKDVPAALVTYAGLDTFEDTEEFANNRLHPILTQYEAKDPENGMWRTFGFVEPIPGQMPKTMKNHEGDLVDDTIALAVAIPGTNALLINVEKRERILPGQYLRDETAKRIKLLVDREEREATKKDWAVAKEETEAVLLKTAPIRRTRVPVILDGPNVYVFTGSAKAAEDVTAVIRAAFSAFPVVPVYSNEFAIRKLFEKIIRRDDDTRETFEPGSMGKFKDDEGVKVAIDEENLDEERGIALLDNKFFVLEMWFGFRTGDAALKDGLVRMTHKGDIKAVSIGGELDPEDDAGYVDDMAMTGDFGNNGFMTRITEVWMLLKFLNVFNEKMRVALGNPHIDTSTDDDWGI